MRISSVQQWAKRPSRTMNRRHHSLPFGAELQPDGKARFRLWAPDAKAVALVLPQRGDEPYPLRAIEGGWHEAAIDCGPGTRYFYRIDDELNVPDPAARYAPDGLVGPSELIDPRAYEWQESSWRGQPWHRAVVYELHVGTFTPEGTFSAIIPHLRELADLGINAIELLPIATFPGRRGWGYDGVLPFAPHPTYGRPDDLKRLIEAAHALGISMILDVVYNHFGPEGNYLHRYASGFFTEKYRTPWGSAIDFESDTGRRVREFFIQNALYWLNEYRFDGLRLDAVHAIKDASPTHFVDELAAAIAAGPGRERQVHLILENHDNEAKRLRTTGTAGKDPSAPEQLSKAQWNDDYHHIVHVLLTGEVDGYYSNYAQDTLSRLGRVLAQGYDYQGEAYGEHGEARGERSTGLPPTAFIDFLQNHDQIGNRAFGERLAALTTQEKLRAGFALLLLSPHVPMLFMGEEYGALQPFLYFCDYQGDLAEAITNGRRSEFAQFKMFADAEVREKIPDPNAIGTFERSRLVWNEREQAPHRDWLAYVRKLLQIRAEHVAPRIDSITLGAATYEVAQSCVHVQWPTEQGETLHLLANMSDTPCAAPQLGNAGTLFSTAGTAGKDQLDRWEVRLRIVSSP
jgi:maltooligosyltrehalose trehalohydrolase